MIVAGVGVEHNKLCEVAQKYFVDQKPIWSTQKGLISKNKNLSIDDSIAQYTGGMVQVFRFSIIK